MKLLFNIREFLWVIVSEVEDWLYPYRDRLTPEERFKTRVKIKKGSTSVSGEIKNIFNS